MMEIDAATLKAAEKTNTATNYFAATRISATRAATNHTGTIHAATKDTACRNNGY